MINRGTLPMSVGAEDISQSPKANSITISKEYFPWTKKGHTKYSAIINTPTERSPCMMLEVHVSDMSDKV